MSTGIGYVQAWQVGVGWLEGTVEFDTGAEPLEQVAVKIEAYMKATTVSWEQRGRRKEAPIPLQQGFYRMPAFRGPHSCTIQRCGHHMSGDYGFGTWCFPSGIVHYIRVHNYQPPQEFLDDLAKLPDLS